MPYIDQERRKVLDGFIKQLSARIASRGEFNYVLTCLAASELRGLSYAELASLIGDIELVKMELWRRLVVPYEENKRKQNGDVFVSNEGEPGTDA